LEEKPVVYIFHGDDELAVNQAVARLFEQLGDPATADMNTTRLDGASAMENDLMNATATMPFLAERRLVVVTHPFARLNDKNTQKRFCAMMENLPDSTALVLIIQDQQKFKQGSLQWETLTDRHWLSVWCAQNKPRAYMKAFPLPQTGAMPNWIKTHAIEMGGKFDNDAAHELAGLVENNTRIAAQEIAKLLTYVNNQRPVSVKDVQELTAFRAEASIFDLVDSMAERNPGKSLELLHHLLEEQDEQSIFPMVVRQFRLLIQTRALLDDEGGVDKIQQLLKVQPFVARKLLGQAKRFSLERLKQLYRELLKIDIAAKSTEMSFSLALDLFITSLS